MFLDIIEIQNVSSDVSNTPWNVFICDLQMFICVSYICVKERPDELLLKKYSQIGLDNKGISKDSVDSFISELPLTRYLKDGFGLEPKKWAIWSNGLISSGGIDFNINQLGRRNDSNGFTMGADIDLTDNSLFGFAIREENEDVTISTNGSKFKSDNINISLNV